MQENTKNNTENSSLNNAGYSVTLTFQEWQYYLKK